MGKQSLIPLLKRKNPSFPSIFSTPIIKATPCENHEQRGAAATELKDKHLQLVSADAPGTLLYLFFSSEVKYFTGFLV